MAKEFELWGDIRFLGFGNIGLVEWGMDGVTWKEGFFCTRAGLGSSLKVFDETHMEDLICWEKYDEEGLVSGMTGSGLVLLGVIFGVCVMVWGEQESNPLNGL